MRVLFQSEVVLETVARLRRLKWASERVEARVRFALHRGVRQSPLSEAQVQRYHREGYLLVSGLIPDELVSRTERAIWKSLRADSQAPETWANLGPSSHVLRGESFIATYTEAMLAAAAQLAGEDVASFGRPRHALTINVAPVSGDWRPRAPHLDRTAPEWRQRTFPRPYRIGAMTYLTKVPHQGGGTLVWPGSHLKLDALARAEPGRYKLLSALSADLHRAALGPAIEVTPSRGDVLFHHYLCAHAGSDNVSGAPRLALNHKW
jgi:hypothetical protein